MTNTDDGTAAPFGGAAVPSFVLPGWDYGRVPAPKHRNLRPVAVLLCLVLVLSAGGAIWLGLSQGGQVLDAPVPAHDVSVDPSVTRGPDGETPVQTNAGPMTVAGMAALHYFVPALGIYSEIVPSSGFQSSRYLDFDTLALPEDPMKSAWYSAGGALAGNDSGSVGTTLLSAHVANNNVWGVLHQLYTLKGGELIYIKDASGSLSTWKVSRLYMLRQTQFPQAYWSPVGTRQLVLVTCGDYSASAKHFLKNIFAVALPVTA